MSQSLPPNPSVEHLKKQAKALLRAARSRETEAVSRIAANHPNYASGKKPGAETSLQEAQLVIAREYGQSSWPALIATLKNRESATPDSSGPSTILLYTNGQSAIELLDASGVPGEKLEWLEVLSDGPVPQTETLAELYRIRAEHMASRRWTSVDGALDRFAKRDAPLGEHERFEELQLWFEHDLYDQLQFVQIMDQLASLPAWKGRTTLYQFDTYISRLTPENLSMRRPDPQRVTAEQLELGRRAWLAFRQPSAEHLKSLVATDTSALPFLKDAFDRLLAEHPDRDSGLGRTERQILASILEGAKEPSEVFRSSQQREEAVFMGDSPFYAILQRLTRGEQPLIESTSGESFRTPAEVGYTDAFRNQRLNITNTGKRALRGQINWLDYLPGPYWIGGCKISPRGFG